MKNFLCSVLTLAGLLGLLPGFVFAQTPPFSISTNTNQWTCRLQDGTNATPLTFAQANSGNWTTPVNFTASCQPAGNLPGTPITDPTSNSCNAANGTTRFFRTTFNPNLSSSICVANLAVRADNGFRVYVDGNVVPGTNTLGDGGETGCPLVNNVIGDNHLTVYTINITGFLNPSSLSHTLIIEVINCNFPTWVAANLEILTSANLNPNFTWSLTGSSSGGPLSLTLTPSSTIFTSHHWLVEVSSSSNGPFTVLYNSQTDPKYRPSNSSPRTVTDIPRSSYIRITHTIFHTCGSASTSVIIPTGDFQGGNETYLSAVSDGEIIYMDQAPSEYAFSDVIVTEERVAFYEYEGIEGNEYQNVGISIFPNPFSDRFRINTNGLVQYSIRIFDSMGRLVLEKSSDETNTQEVDMSSFANGIYMVSIGDKSGNPVASKNILKLNP